MGVGGETELWYTVSKQRMSDGEVFQPREWLKLDEIETEAFVSTGVRNTLSTTIFRPFPYK